MRATEKLACDLHTMADNPAFAMFANRRNRLNRTLKAAKCVPRSGRNQIERFVGLNSANFTFRHMSPAQDYFRCQWTTGSLPKQRNEKLEFQRTRGDLPCNSQAAAFNQGAKFPTITRLTVRMPPLSFPGRIVRQRPNHLR